MIKVLPVFLELALLIFCLIDAIQTPAAEVRNMAKWVWILLILIFPLVGGIAWLVVGRPARPRPAGQVPNSSVPEVQRSLPSTSDIDERLAADLARLDREHEESLRRWEAELRERENGNRDDDDAPPR